MEGKKTKSCLFSFSLGFSVFINCSQMRLTEDENNHKYIDKTKIGPDHDHDHDHPKVCDII